MTGTQNQPPVDLTELKHNVGGRMEVIALLVDHILVDFPQKLGQIREAIGAADPVLLRSLSHALKSPLASFGAEPARLLVAELEALGTGGDLSQAEGLLLRLEKEIARIICFFSDPTWRDKV